MECEQYDMSIWWTLYIEDRLTYAVLKRGVGWVCARMLGAISRRR